MATPTPEEVVASIKSDLQVAEQTLTDAKNNMNNVHYKRLGLEYINECMKGGDVAVSKERLLAAVMLLQAYHDAIPAEEPAPEPAV